MVETMRTLFVLSTIFLSPVFFTAAHAEQIYAFKLLLDGEPLDWDVGEGIDRNGEFFVVDDPAVPLTVYFEGGQLELQLADFGTFSQPHVTGVRFSRGVDPNTFSMGATVRHAGQGAEDYTDTIVFDGAEGGRLTLTEPQDETGAFTRSKDGVQATGEVRVSALDSVRSGDGSAVVLDFASEPFAELERGNLRYELVLQPPN